MKICLKIKHKYLFEVQGLLWLPVRRITCQPLKSGAWHATIESGEMKPMALIPGQQQMDAQITYVAT